MWREIKDNDKLLGIIRRGMTAVTLIGLIAGITAWNNVFSGAYVGPLILINLQLIQIFVPGLLYATKAYMARKAGKKRSLKIYSILAFFTFWYWLSAEVRHAFHPQDGFVSTNDWENYTYSLVWLLYSVGLLILGLKRQNEAIRLGGLGVLSVVVLKVFLSDMSQLEGLARALSFMGLGAALIGIGYLYQKMKTFDSKDDQRIAK